MKRRAVTLSCVLVIAGAGIAAPAGAVPPPAAPGGTVLGSGYHAGDRAGIATNRSGAAVATWYVGGVFGSDVFSSKSASGTWQSSDDVVGPAGGTLVASMDASGTDIVIYDGSDPFSTDGTFFMTSPAGGRHFTSPRRIFPLASDAASVSPNGHSAILYTGDQRKVALLDPDGHVRARVPLRYNSTDGAFRGSVVANDDGSAIASWDEFVPNTPCYRTVVATITADGHASRQVLAHRCGGGGALSTLTASSTGDGAVLSWFVPRDSIHQSRRYAVALQDASGRWIPHFLPSLRGDVGLIAPAMAGDRVSVWWTVKRAADTAIYLEQHQPGGWNPPALVHRYAAPTEIATLVGAQSTTRHLVAWTALPNGDAGVHISRLRTSRGDQVRTEKLAGSETVLAGAASGRRLVLLTSRRVTGEKTEQIVARER